MTFTKLQTAQQLQKLLRGAGCIQKHRSTLTSSWAISSVSHILTQDPFVGTTTSPHLGRKPCRRFLLGDDFRNLLSRTSLLALLEHAAISVQPGMLLLVPGCLLSTKASSVLHPGTYLSVRALLCVSLAAWRSSSSRFLSVSSLSTSPRVHFLGLINRISFKSSSFSLINMRRSRSESSTPGQASLSSLASCIFRFAILKGKKKKHLLHEDCLCYLLQGHTEVYHDQPHLPLPWRRLTARGQPPSRSPYHGAVKRRHRREADTQNGILTQVCSQWWASL